MKRKRDTTKFYAVKAGAKPGIYTTWAECQAQTRGWRNPAFKSFPTYEDAKSWMNGVMPASEPTRWYAVAVGSRPGLYTEWDQAQRAYAGVSKPQYKRFDSESAAMAYLKNFNPQIAKAIEASHAKGEAILERNFRRTKDSAEDQPRKMAKIAKTTLSSTGTAQPDDGADDKGLALLRIWTDGSSRSNGKVGAEAGVGVYFGDGDKRNVSERLQGPVQTNQRAELTAILRALQVVPKTQPVRIISDSKYAISCVTEWFINWRKNNWKTKEGEVKNKDLVQDILEKIEERNCAIGPNTTTFTWVKGHGTDVGNNAADRLAVAGATGMP